VVGGVVGDAFMPDTVGRSLERIAQERAVRWRRRGKVPLTSTAHPAVDAVREGER
jgi:hypothetical protein